MSLPLSRHNRITFLLLGVLLTLLLPAARLNAWSYHSYSNGFTVSLPDDWVQVPDEILTVKTATLPILRSGQGTFETAFQPQRNQRWLEYPYILVEVIPYNNMGFQRQVDDAQIAQIVKNNTGLDPAHPPIPVTEVMEGGAEREDDTLFCLDSQSHRFTWTSANHLKDIGDVRTRQWGIFGRDALVQITLYESGKGSDRLRDMTTAVIDSFKFEAGREYRPAVTLADIFGTMRGYVGKSSIGLIATISCVGIAVLFAIFSLFNSRTSLPQEQPFDH